MEKKTHSSNISGLLLSLGLLLLSIGGLYYWSQSRQPGIESDSTKQLTDSLQAERKQLDDQLDELRNQLSAAKADNASLTDQLEGLNALLSRAYDRLGASESARIDRFYTARPVNKDMPGQKRLRDSLSNQLALMNEQVNQISGDYQQASQQNSELQRSLNQQDAKLQTMVSTSAVTGDGFQVSFLKSNKKPTAKAKKVNTLDLSFSVPAERRLEGRKSVYLSLVHESGRSSARPLPLATITLPSGNLMIPIDAMQTVRFNGTNQRINFSFHPTVELKPGIYRASIYTDDAYLGSVAVELRNSFWFF